MSDCPTYNHTRGDSELYPCPECAAKQSPEAFARRLAVAERERDAYQREAEAAEARLEAAKSVIRDVRSALTDFDECSMERAANALEIVLNWEVKSDE